MTFAERVGVWLISVSRACLAPGRYRLVLRAYFFADPAGFVEKLNHRIPRSIHADNYAIVTLCDFNPQRRGFVG